VEGATDEVHYPCQGATALQGYVPIMEIQAGGDALYVPSFPPSPCHPLTSICLVSLLNLGTLNQWYVAFQA
jgi:hypothetical protein